MSSATKNDILAIALVVLGVVLALYLLFAIVGSLFNNIGSILLIAFIGLVASIVWLFVARSNTEKGR